MRERFFEVISDHYSLAVSRVEIKSKHNKKKHNNAFVEIRTQFHAALNELRNLFLRKYMEKCLIPVACSNNRPNERG